MFSHIKIILRVILLMCRVILNVSFGEANISFILIHYPSVPVSSVIFVCGELSFPG